MSDIQQGVVVRSTGSWHEVDLGERTVQCRVPGRFRLEDRETTNPLAVGDRVAVRLEEDGTGRIEDVLTRSNVLTRRAAGRKVGLEHVIVANVDFAWVVQSVRLPRFNPGFVDRFFVAAERDDIPAGIIMNKMDLAGEDFEDALAPVLDVYGDIGYEVILASATEGRGIELLKAALKDKTSVVAGPSGVGKTSLLNAVEPSLNLKTGNVSARTRKGQHVTTFATCVRLADGGYVIDTPGLREYGLVGLEPADVGHYFREFRAHLPTCRFPSCTHDHEPDCAVIAAVERGDISEFRYRSYLNILDSTTQLDTGR